MSGEMNEALRTTHLSDAMDELGISSRNSVLVRRYETCSSSLCPCTYRFLDFCALGNPD